MSAQDSTEIVTVRGDIDLATVGALRNELTGALARATKVVLDLREVTFMDTQGLAAVIEAEQASSDSARPSSSCARPRPSTGCST